MKLGKNWRNGKKRGRYGGGGGSVGSVVGVPVNIGALESTKSSKGSHAKGRLKGDKKDDDYIIHRLLTLHII